MKARTVFAGVILTLSYLLVLGQPGVAQGLNELKARLPVFSSTAEGQQAQTYMYFPSADLMLELQASAAAGTFSDIEFAYLVGSLELIATQLLANAWYSDRDEATIATAAQRLYFEAKTMQQPFQPPKVSIEVAMDAEGLTFNFAGVAADGVTEVSTRTALTWAQVLAAQ